jgi:uncharacterized ferritin-like protein (DUF455 family)
LSRERSLDAPRVVCEGPAMAEEEPRDIRAFCVRLLSRGDLTTKLRPPRRGDGAPLDDADPDAAVHLDAPARDPGLAMTAGLGRLPRPGELRDPRARARCLARFAHHELMAAELFAWALLRWPEAPRGLRRGLLGALADEQRHCRLYLDRLEAHGAAMTDFEHSDYFWKQAPAIAASPHGVLAFLAAMGLTLEQANLDFSLTYRDAFREAGDEASARVCQVVHDDEITHVRLAAEWIERLADSPEAFDPVAAYERYVPFPLGASRAKGRRFEPAPRREAGLASGFIDHVREAKSPQQARPGRRTAEHPG